jgi:hypothetical protein
MLFGAVSHKLSFCVDENEAVQPCRGNWVKTVTPDDGFVRPEDVWVSVTTQSALAINEIYFDGNLNLILYRVYLGE